MNPSLASPNETVLAARPFMVELPELPTVTIAQLDAGVGWLDGALYVMGAAVVVGVTMTLSIKHVRSAVVGPVCSTRTTVDVPVAVNRAVLDPKDGYGALKLVIRNAPLTFTAQFVVPPCRFETTNSNRYRTLGIVLIVCSTYDPRSCSPRKYVP